MSEKRITLAAIAGAHGIGGEVRLKLFADSEQSFKSYKSFDADGVTLTLKSIRHGGKSHIARFAELTDRNAAEALRGTELTVPRSALPPLGDGEYYYTDLIGLPVMSDAGDAVGKIVAVENFGAGDVIEIEKPDGKQFMVPSKAIEQDANNVVLSADFLP